MLVGAGKSSTSINLFFPFHISMRAGDRVTWTMNANGDPHSVSFLSGGEIISHIVPLPGGGPKEFVWNPTLLVPTRRPGQSVETYRGRGIVNSGTFSALSLDAWGEGMTGPVTVEQR